jgi:metal-dependent amidase/aminoacylase/carboxypeptidase family protein
VSKFVAASERIFFNAGMNPNSSFALGIFLCSLAFTSAAQNSSLSREEQISSAAESLRPKLIEQRRDFHMHPELSNREVRTARVIAERLREIGMDEIKTNVAHHGIVALLKGKKLGPVVAVRADFDALPIHETIDVPYKSKVPNVKHACGHDVHTAVQLGVAEVLSKMRDEIPGTIKFIFQPAEEGPRR